VQGRVAVAELTGQNSLADEAGTAFATSLCVASGQVAPEGLAEGIPDDVTEEKVKEEKLGLNLCLSYVSVLLTHGIQPINRTVEEAVPAMQVTPLENGPLLETAFIRMDTADGSTPIGALVKTNMFSEQTDLNSEQTDLYSEQTDLYGEQIRLSPDENSEAKAMVQTLTSETEKPQPNMALLTAKGKYELDQTDIKDARQLHAQGNAKAVEYVGNGFAREVLKSLPAAFGESVEKVRGQISAGKTGDEKAGLLESSTAAMVMAHRTENAQQEERAQAAAEIAPENTARKENAAMQVARASVLALKRGMTEYRVRLSPEGLGEVEVTVVSKGKMVSLSMRTDNEAARGLILGHADELRTELGNQNYQVNGLSVEVGMDSRNGAGFFGSREHAEPAFDHGPATTDHDTTSSSAAHELQTDSRPVTARSNIISYRI